MSRYSIAKVICVIVGVITAWGVHADTWTDPDTGYTWTYQINGDTVEISRGISPSPTGTVVIPSIIGGKIVTIIGDGAFDNCSSLTDVTIPNSVTNIGDRAFGGCSGLTSVTIPDNVTNIGWGAFSGCSGLTSMTIGSGITDLEEWLSGYFFGCEQIRFFSVSPDNPCYKSVSGLLLTKNGKTLVRGVNGSVNIPDGVTRIERFAFFGCRGLTSVTISDSVTSIGDNAFHGCGSLRNFSIPSNVTSIGSLVFYECSQLTSVDVAEANPSYREISGFLLTKDGKTLLQPLIATASPAKMPDGITSIGYAAFAYRSDTESLTIPHGVTNIGDWAFDDCSGIKTITIPESVTKIGKGAFRSCGAKILTIPDSVTSIGDYAFSESDMTSVVIGSGVSNFGERAFSECRDLVRVTIRDGATCIGEGAFEDCPHLASVAIGNGVTSIGVMAFEDCPSLTSVNIPDSMMSIGTGAFSECDNIPIDYNSIPGVGLIDGWVVRADYDLVSVDLTGARGIADNSFSAHRELVSVAIPDGMKSIGRRAFADCSRLASVTIPSSVSQIGKEAFLGCEAVSKAMIPACACYGHISLLFPNAEETLESITLADGTTLIPDGMFADCKKLESVLIPNSVKRLGLWAFADCVNLMRVHFLGDAPDLGGSPYSGTSRKLVTYVPQGSIGWSGGVSAELPASWPVGDADARLIAYSTDDPLPPMVCIATFDANGDGASVSTSSCQVIYGTALGSLPMPVRNGYAFAGWWTAANGGSQISASTIMTGNATFYAHWTENGGGAPGGGSSGGGNGSGVGEGGSGGGDGSGGDATGGGGVSSGGTAPGGEVSGGGATGGGVSGSGGSSVAVIAENAGTISDTAFSKAQTVNGALFDARDNFVGIMNLKTGKAGKKGVKVSATATVVIGGKMKKLAAKPVTMKLNGGERTGTLVFKAPIGIMRFSMAEDGTFTLAGGYGKMSRAKVGGMLPNGTMTFTVSIDSEPDFGGDFDVLSDALPGDVKLVVTGGKKLDAGKAASLKYKKFKVDGDSSYELVGLDDEAKPNISGLKLSYTPKTGVLKGSFKVYATNEEGKTPKLKKATANIVGFVLDFGEGLVGVGEAAMKRPSAGPWEVMVR